MNVLAYFPLKHKRHFFLTSHGLVVFVTVDGYFLFLHIIIETDPITSVDILFASVTEMGQEARCADMISYLSKL